MKKKIGGFFLAVLIPVIYIATMFVATIIISIVATVISLLTGTEINLLEYNNLMIISIISVIVGFVVAFIYAKAVFKATLFEKHRINILMVLLSLVIGVSCGYFASNLPALLFPNSKPAENPVTDGFTILTVIVAMILAPICEELVFRKYIMDAGRKKGLSVVLVIFVSALVFALAHDPTSIIYIIATMIMGLTFAFSYHKSGVIIYSMLMHFTNNSLSCIASWIMSKAETTDIVSEAEAIESTLMYDILFTAGCFVVLALSMFAFCVLAKKNKNKDIGDNNIIKTALPEMV